jgi:uncharacterized protein with gpF-like domain
MVNARQGPNNNRNQRGQQVPPPPPNPNMEQFIAAQMQILQGITAAVQQFSRTNRISNISSNNSMHPRPEISTGIS